jgi:hypothetical protein
LAYGALKAGKLASELKELRTWRALRTRLEPGWGEIAQQKQQKGLLGMIGEI